MSSLDWPGLLRAGLGRVATGGLGLTPEAFWRLTPAELALMLGDGTEARPMTRDGVERLMSLWPDRDGSNGG